MPPKPTLSQMSSHQLLAEYNALAPARGLKQRAQWKGDFTHLVEKVALLRATPPLPPDQAPPKPQQPPMSRFHSRHTERYRPVRRAVLEALCFVTHYEDIATGKSMSPRTAKTRDPKTIVSVGLPYPEVLARVRRRCPGCKTTGGALRFAATMIRNGTAGYEAKLPHKRPHGTKGRKINGR
jgi:hypothetical protein